MLKLMEENIFTILQDSISNNSYKIGEGAVTSKYMCDLDLKITDACQNDMCIF